jgi:ribonuclease HI
MIRAYFQGICNPNKDGGLMVYETIIYRDYVKVRDCMHHLDKYIASNNIAEYCGLIAVLKWILANYIPNEDIYIFTDSQLVEGQLMKGWNLKSGKYKQYAEYAIKLMNTLKEKKNNIHIIWKPIKKGMLSLPNVLGNPDYE